MKFLVFSIYGIYNFQHCKQNVGAGKSTLVSISDGLGSSIFRRNMEKVRPMGKRWMEMLFCSRRSRDLDFEVVMCRILFRICTLTSRVNNYVYRREKV